MARTMQQTDESEAYLAYCRSVRKHDVLSREEEAVIAERAFHGDPDAKHALILANLRLVIKTARIYRRPPVALLDLIQAGNKGLVLALEKYRPGMGTRVSTYASYWIRKEIRTHVWNHSRPYRIGTTNDARKILGKLAKAEALLCAHHGEDGATDEAVANMIDVSPQHVAHVRTLLQYPVPLDAPYGEDTGDKSRTVLDLVTGNAPNPELAAMRSEKDEALRSAVMTAMQRARLEPRERFIIENRVMTDDEDRLTLQQIGDRFGVTRERVRQLEARALRRLKPLLASALELAEPIDDADTVPGTIPAVPLSPS